MTAAIEPGSEEAAVHDAVYFDRRDYAGPIRRMIILGIDIVAVFGLVLAVGTGFLYCVRLRTDSPVGHAILPMLLTAYLYLTLVQRSRIGTLGYWLAGVRIVNIHGRRPSLLQMTVRLIPLLPVPWSLLFDLGWMLDEPTRQTLRDKWAGTYVVRRRARPIGRTTASYKRICFAGLHLIFPEVGPRNTPSTSASAASSPTV